MSSGYPAVLVLLVQGSRIHVPCLYTSLRREMINEIIFSPWVQKEQSFQMAIKNVAAKGVDDVLDFSFQAGQHCPWASE